MFISIHKMASLYFPLTLHLPIYPQRPYPSTSGSTSKSLPLNVILERAKAARQCLKEESKAPTSSKHRVKQGPIKKSKN